MGFITGGPNEAIVVSGVFHSQPLIVVGGWAFVIPCIQKVQRLPLTIITLKVCSPHVYTMQGVPLSVTGIAQVLIKFFRDDRRTTLSVKGSLGGWDEKRRNVKGRGSQNANNPP